MNRTEHHRLRIGELARLTGVHVRTIRFYSDAGLVPESGRTEAGYRLYDDGAIARLRLVRSLRDLGVGLGTIERVLERELTVAEVAAAHAATVDAEIRSLALRRSVLRAIAAHPPDEKDVNRMYELATLSADERRRIVDRFVDEIFADLDGSPEVAGKMRSVYPDLPEDPTPAQVAAWVELASLIADPSFRSAARRMAARAAADPLTPIPLDRMGPFAEAVAREAGAALDRGIAPDSEAARAIVEELLRIAGADASSDRSELADRLDEFSDRRVERYWELLGTINGWPPRPPQVPAWEWLIAALRARTV